MSKQQRIAFLAVAATIALAAIVVLRPGGDDAEPRSAAAQTTPTPTSVPTPAGGGSKATATPTAEPRPKRPEVPRLRAGRERTITVNKGDTVRFAVVPNTAEEVHVHGYDVFKEAPAGKPTRVNFKADIEGVFEIEFERSGEQIARLKVEP